LAESSGAAVAAMRISADRTWGFVTGFAFFGLPGGGGGRRGTPGRCEGVEFFEGAALARIDVALEALEGGTGESEGVAGGGSLHFRIFIQVGVDSGLPEIDFDAVEAPLVRNEGVDEKALGGIGRGVLFVEFGGECGEILGGFVEHNFGFGMDAVFQGVLSGFGFAGFATRSGRLLGVGSAGCALFLAFEGRVRDSRAAPPISSGVIVSRWHPVLKEQSAELSSISQRAFHILLALALGEKHGCAIGHDLMSRTSGRFRSSPDTLYLSYAHRRLAARR
jgi:hypothetical protein